MATTRASLGSIVNVVTSSAGTIVEVLGVVNDGVSMASATMKSLKQKQAINIVLENAAAKHNIKNRQAVSLAETTMETAKFCDKGVAHQAAFDEAYAILTKALVEAGMEDA
jgi:ribosomal protein L20A (L18A)